MYGHSGQRNRAARRAFTLMELLVVVAIMSALTAILVPTISGAVTSDRTALCQSNLRYVGGSVREYRKDHGDQFPWYKARYRVEHEGVPAGTYIYFWGTDETPVNRAASWMDTYWDFNCLLCPSLKWGEYVPQGSVSEPTTTYAYNAAAADPAFIGRSGVVFGILPGEEPAANTLEDTARPADLMLFADSGVFDDWVGAPTFKNQSYLDYPVVPAGWTPTPTNHFRHGGRSYAVSANGNVAAFQPNMDAAWKADYSLGFVSDVNAPYYE